MPDLLLNYIEACLTVSVIIAVILLFSSYFKRRYISKFRYYLWLFLALRLLFPFNPASLEKVSAPINLSAAPVVVYSPKQNQNDNISQTVVSDTDNINTAGKLSDEKSSQGITSHSFSLNRTVSLNEILALVWAFGTALLFCIYILSYLKFYCSVQKFSYGDEKLQKQINALKSELSIRRNVKAILCTEISSPMVLGLFNPKIYVPSALAHSDELPMMLRHELVHFKRNDIVYKFIITLARCLYWFNPLVWIMEKKATEDIEISCDDEVVRNQSNDFKAQYSESILSVLKNGHNKKIAFSTSFSCDKSTIAGRFKNIFDTGVKRRGTVILPAFIIIITLCTAMVSCSSGEEKTDNFEIPRQAMDFIDFYVQNKSDDNFSDFQNYYFGFAYLYDNDLLKEEYKDFNPDFPDDFWYELPLSDMMDVYQFLMADTLPADWWVENEQYYPDHFASDYYSGYGIKLTLLSCQKTDSGFVAAFARLYQGVPMNNIKFTMEKQTIEIVPDTLASKFKKGDEIYRIKNVETLAISTNENPQTIEINNLQDFLSFIEDINKSGYYRTGNTYLLNTDLDLSGVDIQQIGTLPSLYDNEVAALGGFNAIFDGQGHTISNLTMKYNQTSVNGVVVGEEYVGGGLFHTISRDGVVRNLNIIGAHIEYTDLGKEGGFEAGVLASVCNGTVENCHISDSTVSGTYGIGGLCGEISGYYGEYYANISNCTVNADVTGSMDVGVLSGLAYISNIQNCTVSGSATGVNLSYEAVYGDSSIYPYRVGGFSGSMSQSNINSCNSSANIYIMSSARTIGAFAATSENCNISHCTYDKSIKGSWPLVGYAVDENRNRNEDSLDIKPI